MHFQVVPLNFPPKTYHIFQNGEKAVGFNRLLATDDVKNDTTTPCVYWHRTCQKLHFHFLFAEGCQKFVYNWELQICVDHL